MARKTKSTLAYTTELVDPKFAADGLAKNPRNRPLSERLGDRYADAMSRGEWEETGDPIRFNCDGTLIDGQHRLYAVIKSGVTLPMLVVRGLPRTAFHKIDGGKRRTNGDHLAASGEVMYNHLASAIRWYGVIDKRKSWKTMAVTSSQMFLTLKKNPKIRDSVSYIHHTKALKIASGSILAACHYAFAAKDKELADKFIEQLAAGEGLKRTDPVYVLRERLRRNRQEREKLPQDCIAVFVIKSWNATRKGESIKKLVWLSDESFPVVQ